MCDRKVGHVGCVTPHFSLSVFKKLKAPETPCRTEAASSSHVNSSSSRWLNPLFRTGCKRRLEEEDLYEVLPEDRSERLGLDLQR